MRIKNKVLNQPKQYKTNLNKSAPPARAGAVRRARRRGQGLPAPPSMEIEVRTAFVRRAANGGLLIGIAGPRKEEEADALAERFRAALPGATVTRPSRTREVRLIGFDESVFPKKIIDALAARGGCGPEDVRMGPINWGKQGREAAWAQLPIVATIAVAREGEMELGWAAARVELLGGRPFQCFKCWGFGHIRVASSGAAVDRNGACYRCGRTDHITRVCIESASCAVCVEEERDAGHHMA